MGILILMSMFVVAYVEKKNSPETAKTKRRYRHMQYISRERIPKFANVRPGAVLNNRPIHQPPAKSQMQRYVGCKRS